MDCRQTTFRSPAVISYQSGGGSGGGSVIYVGDSSNFRVTFGSDTTTNLAKKTELQGSDGCIFWLPSQAFKTGVYQFKLEGLLDGYGKKSLPYSFPLNVIQ